MCRYMGKSERRYHMEECYTLESLCISEIVSDIERCSLSTEFL
jgi:hypothetical protein